MTLARIVVYHTDGHSIWLAPWAAKTVVVLIAIWVLILVAGWVLKGRS